MLNLGGVFEPKVQMTGGILDEGGHLERFTPVLAAPLVDHWLLYLSKYIYIDLYLFSIKINYLKQKIVQHLDPQ